MCGIFSLLNISDTNVLFTEEFIKYQFMLGQRRGPEHSVLQNVSIHAKFGFHRLAINGLNDKSNQPICIDDISLICNGEIYNYKELYELMKVNEEDKQTDSDCEVIIHLYKKYGIYQTLKMLDGVFAFCLCDNRIINNCLVNTMYVARDPYGVRPLYCLKPLLYNKLIGFASELKMLSEFADADPTKAHITQFTPGTYSKYVIQNKVLSKWTPVLKNVKYHEPTFSLISLNNNEERISRGIQHYLIQAVQKRYLNTERPIACLLSGGLDSSLITALINEEHKKYSTQPLETYSIGLKGSEDLRCARVVADYLGTNHTEIVVSEDDMFSIIPQVIYAIESYDTTTVRASIGNYLLGKYISEKSSAKVIFNGDGSDEICGGYLYMNLCPDPIEFDMETRRLLKDIHLFDVLRSDNCISSHGLEPRTPFLDRSFVDFYLSIPPKIRHDNPEKYLLRSAFSIENYHNSSGSQLLPESILWRRKEAFSDGVSGTGNSLYQILQKFISKEMEMYPPSIEIEKQYYKELFLSYYPTSNEMLPYYWMPKYTNTTDPSARTLSVY
jgi:asparagine synthase (glutamine-hydrolysing)